MGWPKDPGGDGAKLLQSLNGLAKRSRLGLERDGPGERAATNFRRRERERVQA